MRKDEYDRIKPAMWGMFAAALAQKNSPSYAADKADELIEEFEKRFPVEGEANDD